MRLKLLHHSSWNLFFKLRELIKFGFPLFIEVFHASQVRIKVEMEIQFNHFKSLEICTNSTENCIWKCFFDNYL